jgi:hypothetical protein
MPNAFGRDAAAPNVKQCILHPCRVVESEERALGCEIHRGGTEPSCGAAARDRARGLQVKVKQAGCCEGKPTVRDTKINGRCVSDRRRCKPPSRGFSGGPASAITPPEERSSARNASRERRGKARRKGARAQSCHSPPLGRLSHAPLLDSCSSLRFADAWNHRLTLICAHA